ncbi:hypothetical protein EC845_1933 [Comamonas sp. BIGb0124]|uniref:hypothetical protein n=1 Tax=Comamonas sp. BIGb0124 TaxID=2485130 RepID=UPI000F496DA1|nr:hypothetical protein [Comamonas sp. BIGb0124]ROR23020.1 hypothetical protein EC845_1933 [Comamonas sp. BIGb0124]
MAGSDGKRSDLFVNTYRKKLTDLRSQIHQQMIYTDGLVGATKDWLDLSAGERICLLLLAGVGDDLGKLARLAKKDWREFTHPERDAIAAAAHELKHSFMNIHCLTL